MAKAVAAAGPADPQGWREALTAIARRTRDAWARHPWAIDSLRGERFGPNAMAHVEQSLAAVATMRLTPVIPPPITNTSAAAGKEPV